MMRIVCILIGYFIGCIQTAYVVGLMFHVDIRKHGSGNLGTTNALRVLGKKAGLITFLGDICKAILGYLLCRSCFVDFPLAGLYGCVGVVLGHDFPFYLKFKGGKGIAAMIGTMLSVAFTMGWEVVPICAVLGIPWLATGYVSLASLWFCLSIPIALLVIGAGTEAVLVGLGLSLLATYQHRENIKRLKNGTENRLFGKKKTRETAPDTLQETEGETADGTQTHKEGDAQ